MSGYVPLPAPVTADPGFWQKGIEGLNALRDQQAKQASADAYRQSLNPDGTVNTPKYNALISQGPGAWNAGPLMEQQGRAAGAQAQAGSAQVTKASAIYNMAGTASASLMNDPSDANIETVRGGLVTAGAPPEVLAELDRIKGIQDPAQRKLIAYQHTVSMMDAQHRLAAGGYPTLSGVNTGGQIEPLGVVQPSPYSPGGIVRGTGAVTTTASPDTVVGMPDLVVPATADDVKNGLASQPGQMIHISGADRVKRYGYTRLLPPGAQEVPGTGGGGGGPGVVNSDGTRASPDNPPRVRQLNVPGQPPAPGGYQGTGTGGPTDTTPIYQPPTVAPPAAPVAPQQPAPANQPPAPTNPGSAIAAAVAAAKASGKPVPVPGGSGLVANPDGSVGTPNGGGISGQPALRAPLPPGQDSGWPGPRAALQGGVQVASANPLIAPTVRAPGPPSPLVPGDVNAIMAGMNRTRGVPLPGTQVAGATFATGPGYDEQTTAKVSQDRLAADTTLAANYASNIFPQTQALSLLGRGMTTAPTTDLINEMKGWAGGVVRSMGGSGVFDSTKEYDELHKWLSQIVAGNPVAQGSDARLAQVLSGNANTGIHELASADMMKAGIALMRMNATASNEWVNNPAVQRQYGYYANYLRDFNKTVDPRAFAWDMYNPTQKKDLIDDLNKHRNDPSYAQRLENSLQMVRRGGYMGEIRAMPGG